VEKVDAITTNRKLGEIYLALPRFEEALEWFTKTLRLCEEVYGERTEITGDVLSDIVMVYVKQGKLGDALTWRDLAFKAYGPVCSLLKKARLFRLSGTAYANTGHLRESIAELESALTILKKEFGDDHIATAETINTLGRIYDSEGKFDAAIEQHCVALKIYRKANDRWHIAEALTHLGLVQNHKEDRKAVLASHAEALSLCEEVFGKGHLRTCIILAHQGTAYQSLGEFEIAEEKLREVIDIEERHLGCQHISVAVAKSNISGIYRMQGKYDIATQAAQDGLAIWVSAHGERHFTVAEAVNQLAGIYQAQGKYAAALKEYKHAYNIFSDSLGPENPKTLHVLLNLGVTYQMCNRLDDSMACWRVLYPLYVKVWGAEDETSIAIKGVMDNEASKSQPGRRCIIA